MVGSSIPGGVPQDVIGLAAQIIPEHNFWGDGDVGVHRYIQTGIDHPGVQAVVFAPIISGEGASAVGKLRRPSGLQIQTGFPRQEL